MKFKINRSVIRPLDIGFSTDVSVFSFAEKWTINGFWQALSDKQHLPTHVFQFVEMAATLKILEMITDENDKNKMHLTLTDIDKYEENGFFGDRIICIKRCKLYDNTDIRDAANKRHIYRWIIGMTLYDKKEVAGFLKLPFYNDPKKFVCSSEVESELNQDGFTYANFPLNRKPQGLISPWDIMRANNVIDVHGGMIDFMKLDNIYL